MVKKELLLPHKQYPEVAALAREVTPFILKRMPHKKIPVLNPNAFYCLETVGYDKPTFVSIYHVQEDYTKLRDSLQEIKRLKEGKYLDQNHSLSGIDQETHAYEFSCDTGFLTSVAHYANDFRESGFRWNEKLQQRVEGRALRAVPEIVVHAYETARTVSTGSVRKMYATPGSSTEKETARYFYQSLEKIVDPRTYVKFWKPS